MITSSLDALILHVGGASAMSREMEETGVKISHTTILHWYKHEQMQPKKKIYRDAVKRVAGKYKKSVSMDE